MPEVVWETMNIYDKFHKAVKVRIGPAFDSIERVQDKHPKLILPINVALVAALPAWCMLAAFVNARREL